MILNPTMNNPRRLDHSIKPIGLTRLSRSSLGGCKRHFVFVFVSVLVAGFVGRAHGGDSPEPTGKLTEGSVIYKTVDGRSLRIDYTRPPQWRATDSRSAAVFMHGGGWTGGQPGQFASQCRELARRGCVCFRVEYRLLNKKRSEPPATCTEDVSDAFRFIRRRASQFGIDPKRIAAGGGSAGGHLAAFLGMMDDEIKDGMSRKPNALLLFNPVYDNGPGQWGAKRVAGETARFSPAHNISADDPPAIVFLGTADRLIPVATAERFRANMIAAGVESELHLFEGKQHGFFNPERDGGVSYRQTVDKMMIFLDRLGWFDRPADTQ